MLVSVASRCFSALFLHVMFLVENVNFLPPLLPETKSDQVSIMQFILFHAILLVSVFLYRIYLIEIYSV